MDSLYCSQHGLVLTTGHHTESTPSSVASRLLVNRRRKARQRRRSAISLPHSRQITLQALTDNENIEDKASFGGFVDKLHRQRFKAHILTGHQLDLSDLDAFRIDIRVTLQESKASKGWDMTIWSSTYVGIFFWATFGVDIFIHGVVAVPGDIAEDGTMVGIHSFRG